MRWIILTNLILRMTTMPCLSCVLSSTISTNLRSLEMSNQMSCLMYFLYLQCRWLYLVSFSTIWLMVMSLPEWHGMLRLLDGSARFYCTWQSYLNWGNHFIYLSTGVITRTISKLILLRSQSCSKRWKLWNRRKSLWEN